MLDGHPRLDAVCLQVLISGEQIDEVVECVGGVVHTRRSGVAGLQGRAHQRYAVVLVVEGDEAKAVAFEHHMRVQHRAVPVAHLLELRRLQHDMGELGVGRHRCPPRRLGMNRVAGLWPVTQLNASLI